MDYGHTKQSSGFSNDAIFSDGLTSGVGTASETINPDAAESLHSADNSISWNIQRNPHEIGNVALSSHESVNPATAELGEIISMDMPPGVNMEELQSNEPAPNVELNTEIVDLTKFRESKKRGIIAPEAVELVEHTVDEFKKDKITPEKFYETTQEGQDAYLRQSFGREFGKAA